jgi:hypothetical protein
MWFDTSVISLLPYYALFSLYARPADYLAVKCAELWPQTARRHFSIAQGAGLCVWPDQHDVAVFWLADRKTIAQDIVFL